MQSISIHPSLPDWSRIVYGTWRLADGSDTSTRVTEAKIRSALDVGITTFDHADIYGDYSCERIFGEAWRQLTPSERSKTQHITKCGICIKSDRFPDRRIKHYNTSPEYIERSVENSLKYLGLETIDVLLIHRPDPLMDALATGRILDTLVKSGKIRAAGVSNFAPHDIDLLQSAMETHLVTNQVEVSILSTDALTDGTFAHAGQKNMPIMAWSPLAGGRIWGDTEQAIRVREVLGRIAKRCDVDIDAVALAWLLMHPTPIIPIIGTNHLGRIAKL